MLSVRRATAILCFIIIAPCVLAGALDDGRKAYLTENYKKAMKILVPLAEEGNAKAQEMVAIMHDQGNGVENDPVLAMSWYEKSASQGNVSLQHDLGIRYFKGDRIPQNYKKAADWWKLAAESGVVESQYNLGLMYMQGLGVDKDEVEAVKWYERAVIQDHANAQYSLGVAYAFGQGIAVDYEKAFQFFSKAAQKGIGQAQYNLGVLYENGRGTKADFDKAKYWYERASSQGVAQAKRKLASIAKVEVKDNSSVLKGFKPVLDTKDDSVPGKTVVAVLTEKQQLRSELERITQQKEKSEMASQDLLREVNEKSLRIEDIAAENEAAEFKQKELESNVASLSEELDSAKQKISSLQEQLAESNKRNLPIIDENPSVKVSKYSSFAGKGSWGQERELFTQIHQESWIKKQDPGSYFLHLISLPSEKFVNKFFDMYPLQEAEKAYFVSRKGNKNIYNIIYGVYQDRSEALRGRDNLPEGIRKKEPMIRDYASIQSYVAGAN